jgi:hypothetical protein
LAAPAVEVTSNCETGFFGEPPPLSTLQSSSWFPSLSVSKHAPVWQVSVWGLTDASSTHPVRGQNVPDVMTSGRQAFAVVPHLPLTWQGAPAHWPSLEHAHCPLSWSHVPEAQSAFDVQAAATAQLPPCGGYAAVGAFARAPSQIGCAQ